MTVRWIQRYGKERLFLDINYSDKQGVKKRYARESQLAGYMLDRLDAAPTKTAKNKLKAEAQAQAEREHQDILICIADFGTTERPAPVQVPTFGEVVKLYQTHGLPKLKHSTQLGYKQVMVRHLKPFDSLAVTSDWGVKLADLDTSLLRLSQSTRSNVQRIARSILRFAYERRILEHMPDRLPPLKVPKSDVLIPSPQEVTLLLAKVPTAQARLALALMAFAGLRPSELRALTWADLGEDVLHVRAGMVQGVRASAKTGPRTIPLDPRLAPLFPRRGRAQEPLSLTKRGKTWEDSSLNREFKKAAAQLGLHPKLTAYSLRHFAITSWLRRGIPATTVMIIAGHSNLSTTQRYAHVLGLDIAEAARVIRAASITHPAAE